MSHGKEIYIDNVLISNNSPTYFIADISANHDGDIERAKDLIYLAQEAGANAAKFQHFKAETIVSDYGFKNLGQQQSHQAKWKKSVFDVYKSVSLRGTFFPTLLISQVQKGKGGLSKRIWS
jgi:N-acetylneuraminate synthase